MNNENKNFLDSRSLIAIGITVLFFVGWQSYLSHKYPNRNRAAQTTAGDEAVKGTSNVASNGEAKKNETEVSPSIPAKVSLEEKKFGFEDEIFKFEISNLGMSVQNVVLKRITDRAGKPVVLSEFKGKIRPFETRLLGGAEPLVFDVVQKSPSEFVGTAFVDGAKIQKTLKVRSQDYVIASDVSLSGKPGREIKGLTTSIVDQIHPKPESGFLNPTVDQQVLYVSHGGTKDHKILDLKKMPTDTYKSVGAVTMGSLYFLEGVLDKSAVIPDLTSRFEESENLYISQLEYPLISGADHMELNYQTYVGPKSFEVLNSIDPQLSGSIDYGYFGIIAEPLLKLMKWFYQIVGNYGIAIILLTIAVRLIVMPFNIMSYKSMKSMQVIQPKMQALRERYKDDPQTMNKEVMALMRDHKVNPLGGCLPMLLQLPVFFALYRVFGNSIELYQAPFGLWIHDLSLKDPYYVLPVLMGVTMFIQQRMTPTTMDPAQAKVMMFMPILFTFFMISLPSGLTLYIFVSTLFAIIQQRIFMRDSTVAKAVPVGT